MRVIYQSSVALSSSTKVISTYNISTANKVLVTIISIWILTKNIFQIFIIGEDDLSSGGDGVGNAGARIACGIVTEPVEEGMGIKILIIILVAVIILVIAILICIICYCKR